MKLAQILALPFPESLVQLAAYHADVLKVQEEPKGSNRGPWVDRYLSAAGVEPGQPWCASFVTFLLEQVGKMPAVSGPAAVRNWAKWARANRRLRNVPMRGDLFYLLNADGTGHIGIVLEVVGGEIRTIEGNSNNNGSREGYAVVRHQRSMQGLHFIRLTEAA